MTDSATPRCKRIVLAAVTLLAAIVRFPTLGRDSLWMDEILTWGVVREHGLVWPRGTLHPFTDWVEALALQLGDNAFCLRLPSVLIGTVLVIVAAQWALRRLGWQAGLVIGALLALSPFGVYYSQDANHYPPVMLGGVLALITVDGALESPARPSWIRFALAALAALAVIGFQPIGALPFAALGLVATAWAWQRADRLPLGTLKLDARRLLLVVVVGTAAAFSAPWGWNRLMSARSAALPEPTAFAWTWRFWSGTLADFFGACYHRAPADVLLGLSGIAFTVAGYVFLARRLRMAWLVAGAVAVVVAELLPFSLFNFNHYFSPRYIGALVPVLLVGAGAALAEALRGARLPDPRRRVAAALAVAWIALFGVRVAQWNIHRFRTEHQSTNLAMEWIRENTPDNARVFTCLNYTSRATRFLWRTRDMGNRVHEPVSWIRGYAPPSTHQMDAALTRGAGPFYFLQFSDYELDDTPELRPWIRSRGEIVATFPSGTPREPWPIDRNITVWSLRAPEIDPLQLPRAGAEADSLLGEARTGSLAPPWLSLPLRGGASWDFRSTDNLAGLVIDVAVVPSPDGAGRRWLFATLDDATPVVWPLPSIAQQADVPLKARLVRLTLGAPIAPGAHRLEIAPLEGPRTQPLPDMPIALIGMIDAWEGVSQPGDLDGLPLISANAGGEERAAPQRFDIAPNRAGEIDEHDLALVPLPAAAKDAWLIVDQRVNVHGLGDRVLWSRAQLGKSTGSLVAAVEWTHGWTRGAAILPAPGGESSVRVFSEIQWLYGRRPYEPVVELEAPRAWWLVEPSR